jgi:poly-gamma-glutamate capsule biosynthesis protein CapA/YwtB (metallophosphatase superfamily)
MTEINSDNRKGRRLLLIISAAAFCCLVIVLSIIPKSGISTLFAPPNWVIWQAKELSQNQLELKIENRSATIEIGGSEIWQSEKALKVQDGFISDLDRDGDAEMLLLVWKRGRFGEHRPFWITSDDKNYSQHIFIYDVSAQGEVKNKWFASDIGREVTRMKLMDKDPSIILTEDTEGACALWTWESFGLKNLDNEVTFVAYGDNIIHTPIYEYARRYEGGDFSFLYEPFKDEIRDADIAAVQAETVLVDKESAVSGYPQFGSPLEVGEALKDAGFDVISCANNHALDKGIYGIDVTTSFYEKHGLTCIGIQNSSEKNYRPYEIIARNGIRFALFSYTYGTNAGDISDSYPYTIHHLPRNDKEEERFVSDLRCAGEEADFVVVFVHWGKEYETEISQEQTHMTELLAEGKADVVIGTHPHVVQKAEEVTRPDGEKMIVYYSLGNFRSDQTGIRSGNIASASNENEAVIGEIKNRPGNVEEDDLSGTAGEEYRSDSTADTGTGAKARFVVEHSFDGVRLKTWEITDVDAFWKSR